MWQIGENFVKKVRMQSCGCQLSQHVLSCIDWGNECEVRHQDWLIKNECTEEEKKSGSETKSLGC